MKEIVLLIVLGMLAASCTQADDFFPMGIWYEGGVGAFRWNLIPEDPALAAKVYQRDFADIAAHGVNAAVVPNTQPDHYKALLDAAGKNGVRLIMELDREGGELCQMIRGSLPFSEDTVNKTLDTKLKPIMNHPALWGVQLVDEPQLGSYERYAKIADAVNKFAPHLFSFSCIIGNEPVDSFTKTVNPPVVAFDCYPISVNNKVGDKAPMINYNDVTYAACTTAQSNNVPVWAVLQCHAITNIHRFPTPSEIRCMTYLALANGCKGVWWFLYQTEYWNKAKNEVMTGLVDSNFKGDARWDEITKLTSEINKLAPTLLKINLAPNIKVECNGIAHALKDASGKLYVFAVNTDTKSPQRITVHLNTSATSGKAPRITRVMEQAAPSIQSELFGNQVTWSETIAAGDGALYEVDN